VFTEQQYFADAPIPAVMIPINVTHQAIVTKEIHRRLLVPDSEASDDPLPKAQSNLRHTLSTLISFFADSYKSTFGFNDGPPLHDALTIAYVFEPKLFKSKRYHVDTELTGTHTSGSTVVDIWDYAQSNNSWGASGKNCIVTEELNVRILPSCWDVLSWTLVGFTIL